MSPSSGVTPNDVLGFSSTAFTLTAFQTDTFVPAGELSLTSTGGISRTYKFDNSGGSATGTVSGGKIIVQLNGATTTTHIATQLLAAISDADGHGGDMTINATQESSNVVLTHFGPEFLSLSTILNGRSPHVGSLVSSTLKIDDVIPTITTIAPERFIDIRKAVTVGILITVNYAIPVCVRFDRISFENVNFMTVVETVFVTVRDDRISPVNVYFLTVI